MTRKVTNKWQEVVVQQKPLLLNAAELVNIARQGLSIAFCEKEFQLNFSAKLIQTFTRKSPRTGVINFIGTHECLEEIEWVCTQKTLHIMGSYLKKLGISKYKGY